jgi:myo-inositol 2-dehydrogenase / D-chiro-inositol 1-dehydrogenase
MGRMACESGVVVTREEALASNFELAPGLDEMDSLDAPAPVQPDSNGRYPIALPGRTKAL